jgi:hypothetical protein
MMNWGEPDDIEPLPAWMLAETHRGYRKPSKPLHEIIQETLKKPVIPVIIEHKI